MDSLTRLTREREKPGRLQLAILEWQRQLIAKREVQADAERQPEAA
jgi:hypothetical protein